MSLNKIPAKLKVVLQLLALCLKISTEQVFVGSREIYKKTF